MNRFALACALFVGPACAGESRPPSEVAPLPTASASSSASVRAPLAAPKTDDCIVVDESNEGGGAAVLEGTVRAGKHSHPNGSTFTFYVVELAAERCVTGSSTEKTTKEVQLAGDLEKLGVAKLVGARVRVKGETYPEHTAWHVRPVLITADSIDKL